ncbi:MAG: GHKL domain-containing protein [Bacteroidia bacterium]|nr:GHKL domain-containing protein [Bacteroidia bacterium]
MMGEVNSAKIILYLKNAKEGITFWAGVTLLVIAALGGIIESNISNAYFSRMAESRIQKDFNRLIDTAAVSEGGIPVAEVVFDSVNNVVFWKGNNYLPDKEEIKKDIPGIQEGYHEFSMKSYYIIPFPKQKKYRLIPLKIRYRVASTSLPEYNFAGSYVLKDNDRLKSLDVTVKKPAKGQEKDYLTIRKNGTPVFYISQFNTDILRLPFRIAFILIGLSGIFLLLAGGFYYFRNRFNFSNRVSNILLLAAILILRLIMSYYNFPYEYSKIYLFSAETLAFHWLVPSLGDLLVNILLFNLLSYIIYREVLRKLATYLFKVTQPYPVLAFIITIINLIIIAGMILVFVDITRQILSNSQLKIDFSNILEFSRNIYAQVLLGGIGLLLLGVYFLSIPFLRFITMFVSYRSNKLFYFLLELIIVAFIVLSFPDIELINKFSIFMIITLWMIIIYLVPNRQLMEYDLVNYIILIGSFSILLCTHIVEYNFNKKQKMVASFAEKMFSEQDNKIYQSYDQAIFQLDGDSTVIREKYEEFKDNKNVFINFLQEKYFKRYFKNEKLKLFLFTPEGKRLVSETKTNSNSAETPTGFIKQESLGEEIETRFYKGVAEDQEDIYVGTPIIKLKNNDSILLHVQIYPSKLKLNGVYPYFLQNTENARFSEMLRDFDLAIYENDFLKSSSGNSLFPQEIITRNRTNDSLIVQQTISQDEGKRDLIQAFGSNKAVVIRYNSIGWTDYTNTLSLIFFFLSVGTLVIFLIVFLLTWLFTSQIPVNIYTFQFRFQVLLLVLSVFILTSVSVFLLFTIKERFVVENQNTIHDELSDLNNIVINMAEGLVAYSKTEDLSEEDSIAKLPVAALSFNLKRELSEKQNMDINVFNNKGELVLSTQNLMKDDNFTSGLMDYNAFDILKKKGMSEAFIKEKNANIEFLSAYKTVRIDNRKSELGLSESTQPYTTLFLNVPYFDRTEELNRKITNLLGFIISIVMLFIIFIALITIYISRYLTSPLKELQNKISTTKFGIANEPMEYSGNDEIGAIVKSYNSMLNKLKESEKQLAQTERDLAWRQMARQVAHEIKNPLTPIKLSVQHLIKAWGDKHPNIEKMFQKVTQTILSQIDTLTRIADNFSEFATMPEAHRQNIVLNDILTEIVTLYTHQDENIVLSVLLPEENFVIYADKDQILRVFINLCKNAIQAIDNKENKNGFVEIKLHIINDKAIITIKDNGCGMTEEVQKRAFEPNFSTKSSGMGLGLAMVKRIIEASQGEIRLDTIEGEGTTFYIVFPRSTEVG